MSSSSAEEDTRRRTSLADNDFTRPPVDTRSSSGEDEAEADEEEYEEEPCRPVMTQGTALLWKTFWHLALNPTST
ncbi:expressed unknown protein [Seminavis robusta]|uniref:Uncharacterized protein n=1 Tax=Seminavis robusta TaxID=568900 RepID=A0A9N8F4H4_9STRA|nr:expressed unknown protein [Seminavis robusta]|eukprot:Sro3838_g351360.1 n/a (75) ;mRNA; r:4060-4284